MPGEGSPSKVNINNFGNSKIGIVKHSWTFSAQKNNTFSDKTKY